MFVESASGCTRNPQNLTFACPPRHFENSGNFGPRNFPKFPEFPEISRNFPKFPEISRNFPKFPEFSEISRNFPKFKIFPGTKFPKFGKFRGDKIPRNSEIFKSDLHLTFVIFRVFLKFRGSPRARDFDEISRGEQIEHVAWENEQKYREISSKNGQFSRKFREI